MNHPRLKSASASEELSYKRLTQRNIFLTLGLFFVMFLLLFFVINRGMSNLIKNQIYSHLLNAVEENAKTINIFLQDRESDLQSFTKLNIDSLREISNYSEIFASHVKEKGWYEFILIAGLDGKIVFSVNLETAAGLQDRKYFQESSAGRAFISSIFFSDVVQRPVMILSFPLRNRNDRIIGILAASLDLEIFYNLLFDLRLAETSELFLVNSEGILLSPTRLGAEPLKDKGYGPEEANPHTGEKGIKMHIDYRGQEVLSAHTKIPGTDFYLVSEIDREEALRPVRRVGRIMLYVFIPLLILAVILSVLYAQRITAILRKLTGDLKKALNESRAKRKEVNKVNFMLGKQIEESEALTQELKLSRDYIRNLIDSIPMGVIGLDCQGRITHLNRQVKDMVGPELKTGMDLFLIPSWFDDPLVKQAFESALQEDAPQKLEQRKIDRGKGEEYFNYFFHPLESRNEGVTGISLMIENFTERKRLRTQLAEYEKLSALSQLALGAAHEINNPLLGISSFLEILMDETADDQLKQEAALVLENVNRISETIRGLLNFARPSPPQFTKVNLNHLIEETLSFLKHQPIFRKITTHKNLTSSLIPISADLNQIRQILINIFLNAAQSMPEGGEMRVQTEKVKFQEYIRIDISDTGEGIPSENLNRIFNPFFTTKKSEGTGLGLSISQSLIKNHNGRIEVQSKIGQGTVFSIILPIRQKGRLDLKDEEIIT